MDKKSDSEWERFGKNDPYFGVYSTNKFRKENLTKEVKEEFFQSGQNQIAHMLQNIRLHVDPLFIAYNALDFGCGVGRLVIPLSKIVQNVTGVDISDSMLNEAKNNCEAQFIKNVRFFKSDDNLSLLKTKYDLIYSFIVFQHIPVNRGERIFKNLLSCLEDGGVGVIHVTYAKEKNNFSKEILSIIKKYIPFAVNFISLIKGREFFAPQMQMNNYNLNYLLSILQKFGVQEFYAEYTNHGGALGIILHFKKP